MEKKWQKILNLSKTDYNEWKNTIQKDSFAVWALKANKINVNQYMEWATRCYQIPFLTESFFIILLLTSNFGVVSKIVNSGNETFLPVYEWEAILFAGCVEPPKKVKDKYTIPVLATPKT